MLYHDEIYRFNNIINGEPNAFWIFHLTIIDSEIWNRISSVVNIIINHDYEYWPDDEAWRELLPDWLSSFFMTPDQCDTAMRETPREEWGGLPWEFGSWLDAIRDRDWRWWSFTQTGNKGRIVLQVTGIPPRIDAFKQILISAGAQIDSEEY